MLTKQKRSDRYNKHRKDKPHFNGKDEGIWCEKNITPYVNQSMIQKPVYSPVLLEELKQIDNHHKSFIEFATNKTIRYFASRPHVSKIFLKTIIIFS